MSTENQTYENHLDEQEARWFAVYTRYKREKQIKLRLDDKGISNYLPLQKVTRHYTRKTKKLELPLINSYIFVKITKKDYIRVLEIPDVIKFVRFSKNLIAIPQWEIDLMKRVTGEGMEVSIDTLQYLPGDEVEVIGGNLTGLKGKLIKREGKHNFWIELTALGFGMNMQIDEKLLRKVANVKKLTMI